MILKNLLDLNKASSFGGYHMKYIFWQNILQCIPDTKSAGLLKKMLWLTSLIDLLIELSDTGLSQTASRISIIRVQFPEGKT